MARTTQQLVVRGARGSVPTPEARNRGFGGNTTCLELGLAPGRWLIIDCGTGLRSIDCATDPPGARREFHVLLTHYHLDHVLGLPFFPPLYDPSASFTFYGIGPPGGDVRAGLEAALRPPCFPIALGDTPSQKHYVELDGRPLSIGGVPISYARLHHPQGVTAFRLEGHERAVVFATDCERGDAAADARFRELARGADLLIHDAQYTPGEYQTRCRGWGHSSWGDAVEAAREAEIARLVLFHHDPARSDDELETIVAAAAAEFGAVEAAREGARFAL